MKRVRYHLFSDNYVRTAVGLFLVGAFLRLYRLGEFVTFLGDQGRDAIIIKRLLTFEHFPAIGAPTSVGQVYLGPFYYYFIAPWLWFFRFEPIGLALGVAIFSSFYLLVNYFIVKDLLGKKTALISTALLTFAGIIIDYSRFSWNPNLLPLFSLLTLYPLIKATQTKKLVFFIFAGAFLSFSVQLHYLSLLLLPPIVIVFVVKRMLKGSAATALSFLFFSLPLLIFDLRHDFLNSRSFIKLFQTSAVASSNKLGEFLLTFTSLNEYFFSVKLPAAASLVFLIMLGLILFIIVKRNTIMRQTVVFLLLLLAGLSFYSGPKYPHYFGMIYPIYAIVIGYVLSLIFAPDFGVWLAIVFFALYISIQSQKYSFLFGVGSSQIDHAKKVAALIKDNVSAKKFTITGLPYIYSDSIYRYFLEIGGRRALEKDTLTRADELFVVCDGSCWPVGDPQWDIAYFAPNRVVGKWSIDHVTIYKLIR